MADLLLGLEGMGRKHEEETMVIFMFLGLLDLDLKKKNVYKYKTEFLKSKMFPIVTGVIV